MQKQKFFSTRRLVYMAILIAMQIVLTRFIYIPLSPAKRISFAYIPVVYAGLTMGPLAAALVNGIADLIGAFLFPQGAFFPGFTVTALVSGMIYGLFLHRKEVKWYHIVLSRLLVVVICHWGLNTLWLSIMFGKSFLVSLPARMVPDLIQFPIDMIVLFAMVNFSRRLPASLRP